MRKSGSVPYTNETVVAPLFAFTVPLRWALQPVRFVGAIATVTGGVTGGAKDAIDYHENRQPSIVDLWVIKIA